MIENIKSNYIIEFLFCYITERRKLELIIYSKKHQNKLNVELINYKFFTEKYKVAPKNGEGKEYNGKNDQLVFEGIYKNSKRNGKGKEYNNIGKLIFEGEYLNGKRNGYGKEYVFGSLKFEGKYLNGERKSGYNFENNKLKLEVEYLNKKRKHDDNKLN